MSVPRAPFTVAAVQESPVFLDLERSVEKACGLVAEAASRGAALVVFPETWLPGYPVWLDVAPSAALWDHAPAKEAFAAHFDNAVEIPGPAVARLAAAAREARATVAIGVVERDGGTLYNTILFLSPDGAVEGKHRKLVPTYTERLVWGAGDGSTLRAVDTPVGRVGGLVCWEHWMPLARQTMHAQGELVHVAQWPTVNEMHLVSSRAYAFEGRCFVVACGTVLRKRDLPDLALFREIPGGPDAFLMRGGSAVIGPDGGLLAGPLFDEPGLVLAEVDPRRAVEGKLTLDVAGHYARPDVFTLQVDERAKPVVSRRTLAD